MTCHVLGQIHCVSVKSLNWLIKTGELVEKWQENVVKIQWPVTSLNRNTV